MRNYLAGVAPDVVSADARPDSSVRCDSLWNQKQGELCRSREKALKNITSVAMDLIHDHLRRLASGVTLNFADMPGRGADYKAFSAQLDAADVDRLILWYEFRQHV